MKGVKQRYIFESPGDGGRSFYLDHILEEEVYTQLIRAIDALPGQCRKVFRLVLENKSNQEIAEILSLVWKRSNPTKNKESFIIQALERRYSFGPADFHPTILIFFPHLYTLFSFP